MEQMLPFLYVQGYTAALQDVLKVIHYIQPDLKLHHLRQSEKVYTQILECMIENRAELRENPDAFIRHNSKDNKWELWYDERKKHK